MVFGHYTITLKTIPRNQLPPNLQVEPGTQVQCGLRVFHILWIPIFPFSKIWLMKKNGESYKVTPEAERFFDQAYGKPKTPFYAFAGIIIAVLGFGYMKWEDSNKQARYQAQAVANFEKQINETQAQINDPTLNDYYQLKSEHGLYYAAKVEDSSTDSLTLKFPAEAQNVKRTSKEGVLKDFILERKSFATKTVAKADLSGTVNTEKGAKGFKGTPILGLGDDALMQLEKIYRIDPSNLNLLLRDDVVEAEIESVIKRFLQNPSIDTSLALLDSASKNYLLEIARLSKNGTGQEIRDYVESSKNKSVDYSLLMHGRYSYGRSLGKDFPKSDEELLKDFGFYTKLVDVGLWSIDERIRNIPIKVVYISNKTQARADVGLFSNILDRPDNIRFYIHLNKENGEWKVNLPSTWDYTKYQVHKVGMNRDDGERAYREMVRNSLKEIDSDVKFDLVLEY